MKKVYDPSPIHGDYRWDGNGGFDRLNPHPTAIEIEPGVARSTKYIVWAHGLGMALTEVSTLEEAQAVLDTHRGALLLGGEVS